MLHRPSSDGTILIGQPAHAWVSGQLARAWAEPFEPRDEVCLAAEQHDIAWIGWERSPERDPETGLPYTFSALPRLRRLELWSGAGGASPAAVPLRGPARLAPRHAARRAVPARRGRGRAARPRRLPRARARLPGARARVAPRRSALRGSLDRRGGGAQPRADLHVGRALAGAPARRRGGADGGRPHARAGRRRSDAGHGRPWPFREDAADRSSARAASSARPSPTSGSCAVASRRRPGRRSRRDSSRHEGPLSRQFARGLTGYALAMSAKKRLDVLLVERGLAETRSQAQALVLAGRVRGHSKAGEQVDEDGRARGRRGRALRLSRRGEARGGARRARRRRHRRGLLDVGASTGGFTDCLLQAGAARVIALDVGYGQLHPKLREDPRVTVLERTNVRDLRCDDLPFAPTFLVCDVSFIGLAKALPPALACAAPGWRALVLVKPQFEAGPADVGKGGVVRDPEVHRRVVDDVVARAPEWGARVLGVAESPVRGPEGQPGVLRLPRRRGGCARDRAHSQDRDHGHGGPPRRRRARRRAGRAGRDAPPASRSEPFEDGELDLLVVLGGDGTMLRALRATLGSGMPVLRDQLRPGRLPDDGGRRRARLRARARARR